MAAVTEPDVDQPGPPPAEGHDDPGEPWWHAPWRLLVLGLALVFLGGALGYAITSRSDARRGPTPSTSGSCRTCATTTTRPSS